MWISLRLTCTVGPAGRWAARTAMSWCCWWKQWGRPDLKEHPTVCSRWRVPEKHTAKLRQRRWSRSTAGCFWWSHTGTVWILQVYCAYFISWRAHQHTATNKSLYQWLHRASLLSTFSHVKWRRFMAQILHGALDHFGRITIFIDTIFYPCNELHMME